jgi:hypothetical protein
MFGFLQTQVVDTKSLTNWLCGSTYNGIVVAIFNELMNLVRTYGYNYNNFLIYFQMGFSTPFMVIDTHISFTLCTKKILWYIYVSNFVT